MQDITEMRINANEHVSAKQKVLPHFQIEIVYKRYFRLTCIFNYRKMHFLIEINEIETTRIKNASTYVLSATSFYKRVCILIDILFVLETLTLCACLVLYNIDRSMHITHNKIFGRNYLVHLHPFGRSCRAAMGTYDE